MKRIAVLSCLLLLPGLAAARVAAPPAESALAVPAQSDLYLGVVEGLIRQQRYQAAIAFLAKYQQGGALNKELGPRFRILAGDALAGAGRTEDAIASYRGALQSDRAALAYNGIGRAQGALGAWGEAAESFRHAASLDPANAGYLNNLGYAQLKQNLTGAALAPALDALARAHELEPDSRMILSNLALAAARGGRNAQLLTLLDTIPDPGRRRLTADFAARWTPAQQQGDRP